MANLPFLATHKAFTMLGFTDEQLNQMEELGIDPFELVGLDHICRECGNEVENAGYQLFCNACENK